MPYRKIKSSSLSEEISKEIIHAYIMGELKPGQRLSEEKLGEQFGVSRSPVREALRDMEFQGIVEIIPRKGAYVSKWTIRDFLDFSELRAYIECFSARLAAERSQSDKVGELFDIIDELRSYRSESNLEKTAEFNILFHSKILELSQNKSLISISNSLKMRSLIYSLYSYSIQSINKDLYTEDEHFAVAEAIRIGNGKLAETKMRDHVLKSNKSLEHRIKNAGINNLDIDLTTVLESLQFSNKKIDQFL